MNPRSKLMLITSASLAALALTLGTYTSKAYWQQRTLTGTLLPVPGVASQSQDRIITNLWNKHLPVDVKVVKSKKGAVEFGEKFSDGDDWFKELTLSIENTSGKTIVYIGGGFLFPRLIEQKRERAAPPYYRRLMYGHHPLAPKEALLTIQPISVKPGEAFNINLTESDGKQIKEKLMEIGYLVSIQEIQLNVEEIYFDDGTAWTAGSWFRRDSNNPQKYNRVENTSSSK